MSRKNKRHRSDPDLPRVPPAEQLLIEDLATVSETRILCTTVGRGQFARAAGCRNRQACVVLHEFDAYQASEARRFIAAPAGGEAEAGDEAERSRGGGEATGQGFAGVAAANVSVVCTPDFPNSEFELVALPVDPRGEAELTHELLQEAHVRLANGGRLLAATSNDEDQWLHGELRKLFPKVTRVPFEKRGVLYRATKTEPLRKRKSFECEFAFRDAGRLIRGVSRPGVFNHRRLDAGARALINTMEITEGMRVLDLGCGSGAVALAAGCRAPNVAVVALDSHARAVDCTVRGAQLNGLTNVAAILNAEGETGAPGTFDLAVGNPPYFSDFRISEIFLQGALRALKPGGIVLIVTKALAWYEERMPQLFEGVVRRPHKLYSVFEGHRAMRH